MEKLDIMQLAEKHEMDAQQLKEFTQRALKEISDWRLHFITVMESVPFWRLWFLMRMGRSLDDDLTKEEWEELKADFMTMPVGEPTKRGSFWDLTKISRRELQLEF